MNRISAVRCCRLFAAGVSLIAVGACGTLRPAETSQPAFYSLDSTRGSVPAVAPAAVPTPVPATVSPAAPTLIVNRTRAAAGFDSPRIIYVREPHKLEYFAHSEWVDPPARMLAPLLVAAMQNTKAFRAVVLTPGAADGDLRLDTEILRLQHEFLTRPSRVRFTLRATLVEDKTRRVLAWREFEAAVPAGNEDPYGGVVAASRAVQTVLESLATFCAEEVRSARAEK